MIRSPQRKAKFCLSTKCDYCLNDYFENNLRQSYNQIFLEQKETLEMGRPNAVVTSPSISIDDEQMMKMQEEALRRLQEDQKELRKKFGIMQMNDGLFILGGYLVEMKTGEKKTPKYDYL